MSEQLREALSAAVDGEASEFELRRVFDEMVKDDNLSRAWQSYHLIKQAAQGENVQDVAAMGQRIWASLDAEEFLEQDIVQEEPLTMSTAVPRKGRWGLVGGAMAAALALAVVVGGNFGGNDELLDTDSGVPELALTTPTTLPTPNAQSLASPNDNLSIGAVVPVGLASEPRAGGSVAAAGLGDDYNYGPGFVPYSELSAADQARSDGYFLHHVQHQAVNEDNFLSFAKMISYQP